MGWATRYIYDLSCGKTIRFRPHGNSMRGKIKSGQLCTVSPDLSDLGVGDIVLCRVRGKEYLHLIKSIRGDMYMIGNNRGGVNGWTSKKNIFGRVIKIEN